MDKATVIKVVLAKLSINSCFEETLEVLGLADVFAETEGVIEKYLETLTEAQLLDLI